MIRESARVNRALRADKVARPDNRANQVPQVVVADAEAAVVAGAAVHRRHRFSSP
jgi:hypothetical protein